MCIRGSQSSILSSMTGICDNACISYTGFCPAAVGRGPVAPIEIRVVDSSLGSWHATFGGVCVTSVGFFV